MDIPMLINRNICPVQSTVCWFKVVILQKKGLTYLNCNVSDGWSVDFVKNPKITAIKASHKIEPIRIHLKVHFDISRG